jgi:mannose-6-phosphate isomerase-like protein (cupin superfamily)
MAMKTPRIIPGQCQPLSKTLLGKPMSIDAFLNRYVLLNQECCEGAPAHIAVHLIRGLEKAPEPYVDPHSHPDCDEIGLVIAPPGELEYEMILDGTVHLITSPASIFIPAGTVHRARALRGKGAYACILMDARGPTSCNVDKPAR